MTTQGRRVHSIEKAIVLLDCFWREGRALSLTELVHLTGWAKSTIHGMLASMVDSAVIEQNKSDGKYGLGYHLFELGNAVSVSWNVIALARPRLVHIVSTVNESAYLARLCGDELLLAECCEPHKGFRVSQDPGGRLPLHCTSQGKVIMAHHPEAEMAKLIQRKGMEPATPASLTTWEALRQQLIAARENGYACERGEYRTGLQSVAAPIFDASGVCNYAISVVGVQRGAQWENFDRALQAVREAASAVSYDLGYRYGRGNIQV